MNIVKLFIFVILLAVVPLTSSSMERGGWVADNLATAQFTTRISNRNPADNVKKVSTEFDKVIFYTDVRDCKGCDIEHQWWHKGNQVSVVKGKVKFKRYRWWTNKTLTDDLLGDWTVKVVIDNDVVYSKTFTYYEPTYMQQLQEPVQQRLEVKATGECEMQLRYFSGKVENIPDDVYFKFMLKKWGKRCLGE